MMEAPPSLMLHLRYLHSLGSEFKRLRTCGGGGSGGGGAHKQETGTQNASPDFQPQEKGCVRPEVRGEREQGGGRQGERDNLES